MLSTNFEFIRYFFNEYCLIQLCYDYDPALFMFLVVPVCKKFKTLTVGNKEIIKMLVSTVHPDEVTSLSFVFARGNHSLSPHGSPQTRVSHLLFFYPLQFCKGSKKDARASERLRICCFPLFCARHLNMMHVSKIFYQIFLQMSEILSGLVMGTLTIVGENQVGALLGKKSERSL